MTWTNPLPLKLIPTLDSMGHQEMAQGTTGLPHGPDHPGAFGFQRANHFHEGVDLYCPEGTPVFAVEDGRIKGTIEFTGSRAEPASPWWHDTQALLVEGDSGVVIYGEIRPAMEFWHDDFVKAGDLLGHVQTVLKKDKGRPLAMLHLELHRHGTRDAYEWLDQRPLSLLDPTDYLMAVAEGDT